MTSSPPEDKPFHLSKKQLMRVFERVGETPYAEVTPEDVAAGADSDKPIAYDDRTVAFLDILGFKEHIKASDRDPGLVSKIHDALSFKEPTDLPLAEDFATRLGLERDTLTDFTQSFSDCIAISTGTTPEDIGLLVFMVFQKSRELLLKGFISRGGISMGKLFHDGNLLFGPAFNKAYLLESTHADGARVILDTKTREAIDTYTAAHTNTPLTEFLTTHIRRANDGPAYIDLFADLRKSGFYKGTSVSAETVETLRTVLCDALNEASDSPVHFRKVATLAHSFNTALSVRGNGSNYLIRPDILPDSKIPPIHLPYIA